MNHIFFPVLALGGLGAVFGILLGLAAKFLKVEKDVKEEQIAELLPGANCGGCGFAGCAAFASAISAGEASPSMCAVIQSEEAAKICDIMGLKKEKKVRMVARVLCSGTCDAITEKCSYDGISDCTASVRYGGGEKACQYGCCGLGTCVKVCKFGAIHIENMVAVIDEEKCTGCGTCARACPRNVISLMQADKPIYVKCKSKEKGAKMKEICSAGCIGCKICEKNCPTGSATVSENVASINHETCTLCGVCVEKCPKKVIAS